MRISATTLENYRLWSNPDCDWMEESELLDTIRGHFVGNHKVWLGQAFGAVLETPDAYRIRGGYHVPADKRRPEAFTFGVDVMDPALALIDRPNTVFEAKAAGRYGRHDVIAKADQLCGARLTETKTTLGTFDFDKYAESCQWQFMADIFQPNRITYHVFCLSEDERTGVISLRGVESFNLYPYDGMRRELDALVQEFEEYVTVRGLVSYLDQRQSEAA